LTIAIAIAIRHFTALLLSIFLTSKLLFIFNTYLCVLSRVSPFSSESSEIAFNLMNFSSSCTYFIYCTYFGVNCDCFTFSLNFDFTSYAIEIPHFHHLLRVLSGSLHLSRLPYAKSHCNIPAAQILTWGSLFIFT
jgi:hypothetical protein